MSLETKQIHPAVQKALYRKIDGINRVRIGSTNERNFYATAETLEPKGQTNPIEQQMARMCWARVTAAVIDPSKEGLDGLNNQPIYFSSFIEQSPTSGISNANRPLSYNKKSADLGENKENIYRGETGITEVSVDQLSFFIKKMTINFACPDPIDFEERIQPIFLRHGQFIAIEFGWGIEEDSINIPPLSIIDMQDLVNGVRERNLQSAGNYICDVGMVTNYDFKLESHGGYTGTIDVVSSGQNVLNQTTEENVSNSGDVLVGKIKDLQEIASGGDE